MDPSPSRPAQPPHIESSTNPLGGKVHSFRRDGPSRRPWSGYVAHIRRCPVCAWENDEHASFCDSCAVDIQAAPAEASSDTRSGLAVLQKRLERERRQGMRTRAEDSAGGGGWIAVGAVLIAIALVVGPDRSISLLIWLSAVSIAMVGIWQIRRDHKAMRMWGGFLGATAALVLGFVGFRAIQASGPVDDGATLPLLATPSQSIATPGPSSTIGSLTGSMPMAGGGPLHVGQMPGPAPESSPTLAWQFDTGGELYSAPTIANGIVYVTSKAGLLHAVEAATGQELWTHEITSYVTRATPAIVDGVVYVGGGFTFSALDAASGAELWTVPLQYGGQASPTVRDGLVVVSSQQGWIFALDAKTGENVWRLPTEGIVFGAASITGDAVVYGTDEGILYSVDRFSGTLEWRISLPGGMFAAPVVSDDTILATTQAGELFAIDRLTGDRLWSVNQGSAYGPATNGDVVVLAASDGGVYGFDIETGERRWLYPTGKQAMTAPTIAGNLAILGAGESLLALDISTGEAAWYFLAGDVIESPPTVIDRYVFFGSRDGFLNAVRER